MKNETGNRLHKFEQVTGEEDEIGLLGSIDQAKYLELLKKNNITIPKGGKPKDFPYLPFNESLSLVRESQPWKDAANPQTEFLRELRLAIADSLKIQEEDLDMLKIYTAVGSLTDLLHSVDAFVELEQQKDKPALRVDIDVTQNPDKKISRENNGKKHTGQNNTIVISEKNKVIINTKTLGDPKSDMKRYLEQINTAAHEIAELLKKQQNI